MRLLSLAILVVASSSLVSAQSAYTHKGLFKFISPVGYKHRTTGVAPGRVSFFAAPKDSYSSNLMLSFADSGAYTAAGIGKETLAYLKSSDKNAKVLGSTALKLGGKDAFSILTDRTLPNGMVVGQNQVIGVHKGKAVILTFSALKKDFKAANVKFGNCFKSWVWEK